MSSKSKSKGYRVERKIRKIFESFGWKVVRAAGSYGIVDLVCLKKGKCFLFQIKSTKNKTFYYYDFNKKSFEGFPFFLIVDFGYRRIRVVEPKEKIGMEDGLSLEEFIKNLEKEFKKKKEK